MTQLQQAQAKVDAIKVRAGQQPQMNGHDPEPDLHPHGLDIEWAHEMSDVDEVPDDLVQGVIMRGGMSVMFGDSNSGKTFAALSLAVAVSNGIRWLGREVERGLVVYLASESPASIKTRLRAYMQHFGVKVEQLVVVKSPLNFFSNEADTDCVIKLIREIEATTGRKAALIIGDTLARLCAGANENSGEDMGIVVAHVDQIRAATGAHFLLIHHSGKDASKGARGWSGLRAATDTEIEVTEDVLTANHCLEITKQRDLPTRGDRIGFRLLPVTLGLGKWGSVRTSCVVIGSDAPTKVPQGRRTSEIGGAIVEFLTDMVGVKKSEIVAHFDSRYTKSAVYREIKTLRESGKLNESVGIVALARGADRCG